MTTQDSFRRRLAQAPKSAGRTETSMLLKTFGERYRLVEPLGVGRLGAVYKATDMGGRGEVAIKVLGHEVVKTPALEERFDAGARELEGLTHPGLVRLLDHGVWSGTPYLVWELLTRTRTLARRLEAPSPLSAEQLLEITRGVVEALDFAHGRGLYHLNLSPANVALSRSGAAPRLMALVADLGMARLVLREERGEGPLLTVNGAVFGAPAYMAPEQASGGKVDGRSDLYALGVILFEALTGQRLFDGDDSDQLIQRIYSAPPTLERRCPALRPDPKLEAFFERALARSPEERFQTGEELLSVLTRFRPAFEAAVSARLSAKSPRSGAEEESRRRPLLVAVTAGAAATLIGAGVTAALLFGGDGEPQVIASTTSAAVVEREAPSADLQPQPRAPVDDSHLSPTPAQGRPPTTAEGPEATKGGRWQGEPAAVLEAKARLDAGGTLDEDLVGALRALAMDLDGDPRAYFLLARYRVSRGHFSDAMERYEAAVKLDRSIRDEPPMLDDLIAMVKMRALALKATMTLRRVYGGEALEAIDRALSEPELTPDDAKRLRICRRVLQNAERP